MKALVSVVIPCRNEVNSIRDTVAAALNQSYPSVEVLVIDGMSEDGTRQILSQLSHADSRVRFIDNPKKLTPYAFNLGVYNAHGAYIQIVGARNILKYSYIQLLVDQLEKHAEVGCVGGDYQHVFNTPASRYICLAMESKFGVGAGNYRTMNADADVDTVGIPLYRRSIFAKIGLFDERLTRNQDDDFNFRVRRAGYKIRYVHAAKATYLVRASLHQAFQQFRQYGYFKVFVNKKHGMITTARQVVPAAFVAFFALGLPLSLFFTRVRDGLCVVALVYVVAGLRLAGVGLGLRDRLRVLLTCLVLHCAYGAGYWLGILDFYLLARPPRAEFQKQTT